MSAVGVPLELSSSSSADGLAAINGEIDGSPASGANVVSTANVGGTACLVAASICSCLAASSARCWVSCRSISAACWANVFRCAR